MADITYGDFTYWKKFLFKMRDYHDKEFTERIEPEKLKTCFEGKYVSEKEDYRTQISNSQAGVDKIRINKFFPATATVVSTLYPQNPKYVVTGRRDGDDVTAKVLASSMNYYMEEMGAKNENQMAILNAWFNGFGCVKQGWYTSFGTSGSNNAATAQPAGFMGKLKQMFTGTDAQDTNIEQEDNEFIIEDRPFLLSVDPNDIFLDHERPFKKHRVIAHKLKKTLQDIRTCGLYNDLDDDFYASLRTSDDDRDVELTLWEVWLMQKDGLYLMTYCDRWQKPLRWQKMGYLSEGFPFQLLRLNQEPGVTYPISHLSIAYRTQKERDYIMTLQLRQIDQFKNQLGIQEGALTPSGKVVLENNEPGGIVYFKGPISRSNYAPLTTAPIPADLFSMASILETNLQELLTVTGARMTGESALPTATQEKIAEMGNQIRTAGMTAEIRDFMIAEGKKLAQDIKQFATAPVLIKVTGLDLMDESGQPVTEKWINFGQGGEPMLKDAVQGEYDYDIDTTEALRRDLPVVRKQLAELAATAMQMEPLFNRVGKTFDAVAFFKDMAKNFETISNAEKYLKDLPAPPVMPGMMPGMAPPEAMPGPESIPTEESIRRSAMQTPIGVAQ